MAQVAWSEVAWQFADLQGEVCTIQVEDVGIADWQILLDTIRTRGWRHDYSEDGSERRLPSAKTIFEVTKVRSPIVHFWPEPELRIRVTIFVDGGMELLVNPEDVLGQEAFDRLTRFLRTLGRTLRRDVTVDWESLERTRFLAYDLQTDHVVSVPRVP